MDENIMGMKKIEWNAKKGLNIWMLKVAERELEELRVVGQALNSEVNQLELFFASVHC